MPGENASNAEVKAFAQQMMTEHSKAGDDLKALASSKGVKLPEGPSIVQKGKLKMLSMSSSASFDKHCAENVGVKAHQDTVKLLQKASTSAKGPDVRAFAAAAGLLLIVQRQNRHLRRIVDDLLDVSRMLLGKIVLDVHTLDLANSVRHCIAAIEASDLARGAVLHLEAQPVWVRADPVRIEQIVSNLVGNALKYSAPHSDVRLQVRKVGSKAVLRVIDSGAGMSPDLMQHIFEPFVQGPPMAHQPTNGLGIGLALVAQLVELHGGDVHATSDGPGTGSCFEVCLPLAEPASEAAADDGMSARNRSRPTIS